MIGWYLTIAAALVVGLGTLPPRSAECIGWCLSPLQALGFFLMFAGLPVLLGLVATAALAALWPLTRVMRSAVLAGTFAAATGVTVVAAIAIIEVMR